MSIQIYNDTSFKISKLLTNNYSTSFSLGILCFAKEYRKEIYNIYGFVRLADEIVDTFHDQNKREVFNEFKKETYNSITRQFSINPVLNSFQITVNKYNIDKEHIDAFLFSMETDLEKKTFSNNEYQNYIYGSAEVVGLMCLRIFCKNNNEL